MSTNPFLVFVKNACIREKRTSVVGCLLGSERSYDFVLPNAKIWLLGPGVLPYKISVHTSNVATISQGLIENGKATKYYDDDPFIPSTEHNVIAAIENAVYLETDESIQDLLLDSLRQSARGLFLSSCEGVAVSCQEAVVSLTCSTLADFPDAKGARAFFLHLEKHSRLTPGDRYSNEFWQTCQRLIPTAGNIFPVELGGKAGIRRGVVRLDSQVGPNRFAASLFFCGDECTIIRGVRLSRTVTWAEDGKAFEAFAEIGEIA